MDRTTAMVSAAVAGVIAAVAGCDKSGSANGPAGSSGSLTPAATQGAPPGKHACRGQNDCKGQGGCKTDKHACKGQNDCKGQGGCSM
ncbi:MAG TPA: hypothetical protein VGY54_19765 [Polyangiaceae bacterium]|jgi:hypothetical protein|nr:hypothetical protein [Polyangiaceae bacterium]